MEKQVSCNIRQSHTWPLHPLGKGLRCVFEENILTSLTLSSIQVSLNMRKYACPVGLGYDLSFEGGNLTCLDLTSKPVSRNVRKYVLLA